MLFSLIVPFDETGEFLPGAYGPILFRDMRIVETGSSPTVREGFFCKSKPSLTVGLLAPLAP
jgi:hypothetical protein